MIQDCYIWGIKWDLRSKKTGWKGQGFGHNCIIEFMKKAKSINESMIYYNKMYLLYKKDNKYIFIPVAYSMVLRVLGGNFF